VAVPLLLTPGARRGTPASVYGWFGSGQSASGTARILGDVEYVAGNKSSNTFYGLVSNDWSGVASVTDVTVAPPYNWRP
jgi:hypothetical protein